MRILWSLLDTHVINLFLNHTQAMIVLLGPEGEMMEVNPAFEAYQRSFPGIENMYDLLPRGERILFRELAAKAHQGGQPMHESLNLLTEAGREICFHCLLIPLPQGKLMFIAEGIESAPNLTEIVQRLSRHVKLFKVESTQAKQIAIRKQIEVNAIMAQAEEIKHIDPLTFLPNRRLILNALQSEVIRAQRYHTPLSISILDVDYFKRINDTYGHPVGDKVLVQIGHHLRDHIRHPDTAGRYGGEEFLILLPNTSVEFAAEQSARLCRDIRNLNLDVGGEIIHLTVSIGVVELKVGSETWQKLLNRADKAMYQAKEQGRDRWVAVKN
jgi:diguanylate cyclase (GGDEF)-like protein